MNSSKKKRVAAIILIVLIVWLSLMLCDLARVFGKSKPLFCLPYITADDGGSGLYVGLGYGFDIEGKFMPEDNEGVTDFDFYIFGIELF